jgi:acyl-coenzyme A synthetase/AMP-(fatty) acid ligase
MHTGKKVAPFDVDTLYNTLYPGVILASCGVPNKDGTYDEIHIFIEKGKLSADKQEELRKKIISFSSDTSTLYQISSIHFINKLPTTSVGKVKRFQLKDMAIAEREGSK